MKLSGDCAHLVLQAGKLLPPELALAAKCTKADISSDREHHCYTMEVKAPSIYEKGSANEAATVVGIRQI